MPANISFVASVAQFTPKTVETRDERLKLMFRVKARIPPGCWRSTGVCQNQPARHGLRGWISNTPGLKT